MKECTSPRHLPQTAGWTIKLLRKILYYCITQHVRPYFQNGPSNFYMWINNLWAKPEWLCYLSKFRDHCKSKNIRVVFTIFLANAIGITYPSSVSSSEKQEKPQRSKKAFKGTDTVDRTSKISRTWHAEKGKMRLTQRRPKRQCYRKGELYSTIYALIKENQEQEQMFPRNTNEQNKKQHFPPGDQMVHDSQWLLFPDLECWTNFHMAFVSSVNK